MSSDYLRTFQVGKATISIIQIGDLYLPLLGNMNISQEEILTHDNLHDLDAQSTLPVQCFLIQVEEAIILVDAGVYALEPDSRYYIKGFTPPPPLGQSLAELGIRPEHIQHVVITHCHWDHFNGTVLEESGSYRPLFPQARHYLGQDDWDIVSAALQRDNPGEFHPFGILQEEGLLEAVQGNLKLGHGVEILHAPGETPGHQIVRLHSDGETLYCVGDLYHHAAEIDHPEWVASWADQDVTLKTRQSFAGRALAEEARIAAAHITNIGCLTGTGSSPVWTPIP